MYCAFPVTCPTTINKEFDHLLNAFFAPDQFLQRPSLETMQPAVHYMKEDDHYGIEIAAPGVAPEELQITLNGDTLTISNESKVSEKEEAKKVEETLKKHGRWSKVRFTHSVQLPPHSDPSSITAEYKHGILTVRIAKAKEKQAKQIPVKVA